MFGDTVFLVADMFALVTLLNVVSIFAEIQLPSASLSLTLVLGMLTTFSRRRNGAVEVPFKIIQEQSKTVKMPALFQIITCDFLS